MPTTADRTDKQLRAWQIQLCRKIVTLCERDDWPVEKYARVNVDLLLDQLRGYIAEPDQELIDLWANVAAATDHIGVNNTELWLDCPRELTAYLEDLREAQTNQVPPGRGPLKLAAKPEKQPVLRTSTETREVAKARLELEVHDLRRQWSEAARQKHLKQTEYKAAQKYEEELLQQYLRKVGELDEINHGGEWQRQLPWSVTQS